VRRLLVAAMLLVSVWSSAPSAARSWVSASGPHFSVLSDVNEKTARDWVLQLEALRLAVATVFPWAHVDLDKPVAVFVVSDGGGFNTLVPQFAERGIQNAPSLLINGPDRYYLALRADLRGENRIGINPYQGAYGSYLANVFQGALRGNVPPWLSWGLTRVMSNTLVTAAGIEVGRLPAARLRRMQSGFRMPLKDMLALPRIAGLQSEEWTSFDAEATTFVHYLMFGDERARRPQLDRFVAELLDGNSAALMFDRTFGDLDALARGYQSYYVRTLIPFERLELDLKTPAAAITARALSPAEVAAARASFLTAESRPVDARAEIQSAHDADPALAAAYDAEGVFWDRARNPQQARAAFTKAIELGSTQFFTYYRLATMAPGGPPSPERLAQRTAWLQRAAQLNPSFPPALHALANVTLAAGKRDEAVQIAERAVKIDLRRVDSRMMLARLLWTVGRRNEARAAAKAALALARVDSERDAAKRLVDQYELDPSGSW